MTRAVATIDLAAVRANVTRLREIAGPAEVMAVVKADAYGHGMTACARAARQAGATWLGTALPGEALELRADGDTGSVLAWLLTPGDDLTPAVAAGIDLGISAQWALDAAGIAARAAGRPARIHLKADTGLSRNGATVQDWPELIRAAANLQAEGVVEVVGVWSHLACADEPGSPVTRSQRAVFVEAVDIARSVGLKPTLRHLASSGAALTEPDTRFDLVRAGISVYGLLPGPQLGRPADWGLRPAMTLTATLAHTKRVPAGTGVSYGHTYTTPRETTLALVPVGYADGIPRAASDRGPLQIAGARVTIAGRVAMDQVVADVGDLPVQAGDEVMVFGPGDSGEPTVHDWATACDTIDYEIVTRLGVRVPRRYVGEAP